MNQNYNRAGLSAASSQCATGAAISGGGPADLRRIMPEMIRAAAEVWPDNFSIRATGQSVSQRCAPEAGDYRAAEAQDCARSPHVSEEIGCLLGAAGSLHEAVDSLIKRLGSVLAPMPSSPTEEAHESFRVPLAEQIRNSRRHVQYNVDRLQDLMRALEL